MTATKAQRVKLIVLSLGLSVLTLALTGCATTGIALAPLAYRTSNKALRGTVAANHDAAQVDFRRLSDSNLERSIARNSIWEDHKVADGRKFSLIFVEFSDSGDLQNEDSWREALQQIRERAKHTGALILVYAHGWLHNAEVCDSDVIQAREVIAQMTVSVASTPSLTPTRVFCFPPRLAESLPAPRSPSDPPFRAAL